MARRVTGWCLEPRHRGHVSSHLFVTRPRRQTTEATPFHEPLSLRRPLSLCTLALVLALAGCDSTEADPPAEPAPALPLSVGTQWTLARTYNIRYDDNGLPSDTLFVSEGSLPEHVVSLAVSRDTLINGETWFQIDSTPFTFFHSIFGEGMWFTNRTDGLYRWGGTVFEPELAYGTNLSESEVFFDTDAVEARYLGDGPVQLESGATATARAYHRLWKRYELNDQTRGPISPQAATYDALSSELGPLALEVLYVRYAVEAEEGEGEDEFQPLIVTRYERVPEPATAEARMGKTAPVDGFAVR